MSSIEGEWPKLIAQVRDHLDRGTDPKDPAVQALAQRWKQLTDRFTGGNVPIAKATARLYANREGTLDDVFGEGRVPDAEVAVYVAQALKG